MTEREILDSWKEISAYLNRSIKTCQRWEANYQLPVHRLDGSPRASVFAYKDELDEWFQETLRHSVGSLDNQEQKQKLDKLTRLLPFTRTKISRKKAPTSRDVTVTYSSRRLLRPAAAVLVLALIALFLWKNWSPRQSGSRSPDKPRVAVLLFKNNTGDETLDHLREALSDSLIQDLHQSRHLYLLPDNERYRILNELGELDSKYYTPEVLTKIAEKGAVNHVITGSYELSGLDFRVSLNVKKASTWENVGDGIVTADGRVDDYLPMIDELTKKVKSCLDLSLEQIETDLDEEIAKISSPYPEALSLYRKAWKLNSLYADYSQGIKYLEKAVAVDPEFAMAFRALSAWNGTIGNSDKSRDYGQKAYDLSFSDRVSERERLAIQGSYYSDQIPAESMKAFTALLQLYPDDSLANIKLAYIYFIELREYDRAINLCERLINNKSTSLYPYWYLAGIYYQKGLYAKAREYIDNFVRNIQDSDLWHYRAAENYIAEGDSDGAFAEIEKASHLPPTSITSRGFKPHLRRGDTFFFMQNFANAEKEFRIQLDLNNPLGTGQARQSLSWLYMTQGRLREAQEQADLMLGIIQKLGRDGYLQEAHLGLSIVLLASGDLKKALAECESGDSGRRFEQRHIRSLILKTVILAKMKEFENASLTAEQLQRELEEYYKNIASRNPFAVYYNLLGIIELEKGNFDRAAENCLLAKSLFPVQHSDDYILFIDPLAEAYYKSGDWDGARQTYELASSLTFGRYQ